MYMYIHIHVYTLYMYMHIHVYMYVSPLLRIFYVKLTSFRISCLPHITD